jgi:DNA-binding LytR/AlgR family response regulator
MIHIAICDDDIPITECIESMILNSSIYKSEKIYISIFYSGESFTKAIQDDCPFDLIFMDIEMKELDGIKAGYILRENNHNDLVQLIYISNHEEYHMQLFDVQPSGFIKKPIHGKSFEQKLISAIHKVKRIRQQNKPKLLSVHKKGSDTFVPIRKIVYLTSDRRKITLHTVEDQIEYYSTLSEEEDKLSSEQFVRIHQSYLVNFFYVKQILSKKIILITGEELPISEKQNASLKKSYLKFRGSLIG